MESTPIEAQLSVEDDHEAASDLSYDWTVRDDAGVIMMRSTDALAWNITDLPADLYLIEVVVTDAYGASTTVLLDVEVTPLDTDGDWTASCSELTWYDEQTATPCGPDVYDLDDDGDGIRDTRDAFPMDACATVDTDEDGQPDTLTATRAIHVAGGGPRRRRRRNPDTMEGASQDDGPSSVGLIALDGVRVAWRGPPSAPSRRWRAPRREGLGSPLRCRACSFPPTSSASWPFLCWRASWCGMPSGSCAIPTGSRTRAAPGGYAWSSGGAEEAIRHWGNLFSMAAMLVLPWGFIRMSDTSVMWAVVWDVLLLLHLVGLLVPNGMP